MRNEPVSILMLQASINISDKHEQRTGYLHYLSKIKKKRHLKAKPVSIFSYKPNNLPNIIQAIVFTPRRRKNLEENGEIMVKTHEIVSLTFYITVSKSLPMPKLME